MKVKSQVMSNIVRMLENEGPFKVSFMSFWKMYQSI